MDVGMMAIIIKRSSSYNYRTFVVNALNRFVDDFNHRLLHFLSTYATATLACNGTINSDFYYFMHRFREGKLCLAD